jgi:plasmid replication initiation protein
MHGKISRFVDEIHGGRHRAQHQAVEEADGRQETGALRFDQGALQLA